MLIQIKYPSEKYYLIEAFKILYEHTSCIVVDSMFDFITEQALSNDVLCIVPTDSFENEADNFSDIISFQWCSFWDCNPREKIVYTTKEFLKEVKHRFLKENIMEENNDKTIPLSIAKKMYLSEDEDIRKYILSIYLEEELKDPPYFKYKTVEDVLGYAPDNTMTGPNFLNCLQNKLNEHLDIDYIFSDIYLPVIKVIPNLEISNYSKDKILAKFSIKSRVYFLVEGEDNEYIPVKGIFNLSKNDDEHTIGGVSMHASYLAFGSPDIAKYAVKHFARQIFEASMWGYKEILPITWLDIN